jgi:hypothetical protein
VTAAGLAVPEALSGAECRAVLWPIGPMNASGRPSDLVSTG